MAIHASLVRIFVFASSHGKMAHLQSRVAMEIEMRADVGYLILMFVIGALAVTAFFVFRALSPGERRSFHYRFEDEDKRKK
ncbi:hypothetical protein G4G27_23445 [Sphingomonas sp. So64.6b]|uniref:hypothetical protein n=1 Tax=Sphingomonas sp. So64.6b TaxID=2997354 RepID=UPI0016019C25|nr:hypothetical protein [Sphingomonas sp. So64.6b]QNA86601.1 hypothetical protein G4G27_23445 [Sphingomonas sp. So64.6b]